jgi:uncharacterized membrane protein YbhN (UPF0104 family)
VKFPDQRDLARLGIAFAIGGGALALALRGVEWDSFRSALAGADLGRFAFGVSLFFGLHLARAWRWSLLVWAVRPQVPFRTTFSMCCVGFFLINVLPFRLGEFVRPWLLAERAGIPWGSGLATVVVERTLDVAALGVLLLGAVAFANLPAGEKYDVVALVRAAVLGVLVPAALGMGGLVVLGDRGVALAERAGGLLGPAVGSFAGRFVRTFVEALRALGSLRRALPVLFSTGVVWGLNTWSIAVAANAFSLPHSLGFWDGAALLSTICALLMLPAPPGFAGVFEFGVSTGLSLWDVPPAQSAAFALALHGAQFLLIAILGVLFLVLDRIPLGSVLSGIRGPRA